ncbi:sulfotransferase domain-containing protein [Roseivirga sp. BDSF3-8]|uniref:sulfotransferase domain-containing protein n=1 Tax=Roseivirga sp. BDSF3-8 TaxID=3241598 RepID=UPI0035319102
MSTQKFSFKDKKDLLKLRLYDKVQRWLLPTVGRKQSEEAIKSYEFRDDDIIIATYMKSGTTLLQMLLYQLLTDGRMDFTHIYQKSPFIEETMVRGGRLDKYPSPRILKTHFYYDFFPPEMKGRFIVCVRNGMDVAVSKYHHYLNYNVPDLTWQDFYNKYWLDKNESYFPHVQGWLENEHNFDIYYLYYEDLISNKRSAIEGIARFLNISPTEETIQRVIDRTDFSFMKEHQDKFGEPLPGQYLEEYYSMGFGRKYFSSEQQSMFSQLYKQHLSRFGLRHGLVISPNNPTPAASR